jgi:hypothetical protein
MSVFRGFVAAVLVTAPMVGGSAFGQELAAAALERVRVRSTVQPLGPTPFGERINLYTGSLSFTQTDVDYPGTGPTILLTRSFDTQRRFVQSYSFFGDWTFDIPRIETIVRRPVGGLGTPGGNWIVAPAPQGLARCSQLDVPYEADGSQHLWWHGYDLIMPGSKRTLMAAAPGLPMPSISVGGTSVTFTGTTTDNWRIGCLPNTSNGQAGEAFLAVDPEGTKYFLNYLIGRDAGMVLEFDGGTQIRHPIMLVSMLVTRIEDRFGNYVTFSYSGSRLTEILASDGRRVSIAWRPETTDLVASITVQPAGTQPRTTTYEYTTINTLPVLTGVVLPDGSRWGFSNLIPHIGLFQPIGCGQRTFNPATPGSYPASTATLTHPSGLIGQFTLKNTYHGKSYVPGACDTYPEAHEADHPVFSTYSLTAKTFSGPGLTARTWSYTYSPVQASASYDPCAANNSCPDTKWVDVVAPDGVRTRYTFSNRYTELEGKELSAEVYAAGSGALMQTTANAYASPNAGPYPVAIGSSMLPGNYNYLLEQSIAPLKSSITTQNGTAFSWRVATGCGGYPFCFDAFGRPTQVIKSSAPAP